MEKKKWYKLDNAAIIIPPSTRGSSTRVFRIVCSLKQEVKPKILQEALDEVRTEFPHFNVVLRRGLFWYYLDETDKKPVVHIDDRPACGPLYIHGKKSLLYDVSYYGNRINLEMFHVLSDGTGAFVFFKKLILKYIELAEQLELLKDSDTSSITEKVDDAFQKFYQKDHSSKQLKNASHNRAYQIKGTRDENLDNHLIEIRLSSSQFARLAKENHVTVTVFAVSLYIHAILQQMTIRDRKLPIVVSVPVNLRQYFPSDTTRNFYGTINISYQTGDHDSLDMILEKVSVQFKELLNPEEIQRNMNSYSAIEHNFVIKLVPLFLKDIVVERIGTLSARGVTGTISNLGRIDMPQETYPYIDFFSAFMAKQNMQITIASFQDCMTFGICSNLTDHQTIHQFVKYLTQYGLEVEIATNDTDKEAG